MTSLQQWIEAALIVADSNGMKDDQIIPTWPQDVADQFPPLTVGALRRHMESSRDLFPKSSEIASFVSEYEAVGDDGHYKPTAKERGLIEDAIATFASQFYDSHQPDAMESPLPCDVVLPGVIFRKGVKLKVLVTAASRWQKQAMKDYQSVVPSDFHREDIPVPESEEVETQKQTISMGLSPGIHDLVKASFTRCDVHKVPNLNHGQSVICLVNGVQKALKFCMSEEGEYWWEADDGKHVEPTHYSTLGAPVQVIRE
jgi:hypothetical protein